jgi:hypothetical protein
LLAGPCWGRQTPNVEPNTPGDKPVPVITFDLAFPGTTPSHYSIAVESTGKAAYRSDDLGTEGQRASAAGSPYLLEFIVSEATCTQIFNLARELNYFRGDFNYTKTRVADTGTKTLSYSEGPANSFDTPTNGKRTQTVYNYSQNGSIQQLTAIFQRISSTLELGRRIAFLHRFDKLGLDAELKRADEMAAENQLLELQAIAPTLRAVAGDYSVLHIAREHAEHLLELAGTRP